MSTKYCPYCHEAVAPKDPERVVIQTREYHRKCLKKENANREKYVAPQLQA